MWDHITNETVLAKCDMVYIDKEIQHRRLRWLGHVGRMSDTRLPKQLLFSQIPGHRSVGRPRLMWNEIARSDLIAVHENKWYRSCQNREVQDCCCTYLAMLAHVCLLLLLLSTQWGFCPFARVSPDVAMPRELN